ncbi:uncharacterized protein LOC132758031 [Ruditapes philippinarum]|uniref:uncharacterized protein LOC132758031 n=1 Tax=Ruditapes philippinarum TaxID=129788 RepID=UPI00295BA0B8|nr:uncharacterized protein LOC132758031 [Ruditapes philippinarum]
MAANRNSNANCELSLCQPCLNMDTITDANIFCRTCDELQCMDCSKVHETHTFMRSHTLVDANESNIARTKFNMKGIDQCILHQKDLEYFCEDEETLCCSTCAIVNHRKCQSVVDVKAAVESDRKRSYAKVKLQEVKEKAEKIINSVVCSKRKLEEDVTDIPVKIKKRRDEVNKMFDELEMSIVKQAKSLQTETFVKLTTKQLQNEKYLADITTCLETIDEVYENGTSIEQFIVEEKMKEEINLLHTNVDEECKGLETMTVNFAFDEAFNLPPLPFADYVSGQLSLKSHLSEAAGIITPVDKAIKITPVCCVDLKQSKDDEGEPFYTGIDFLPDGRLVVVDNTNKKCLVYNEKLEKLGSYQLSYKPLSIVAISDEAVMITSGNALRLDILRVNKSNQIILNRTKMVTTKYDSICVNDEGNFVGGTYDYSRPVRIISLTGNEKDINANFPKKIYPIETSACTYDRNTEKLILTDKYEHTLYIYDTKTNTRVVVKDDKIQEPRGVTVGPFDTIFVCSKNTHSIVQISQTGRIVSSHKTDMEYPRTICISRDKSFLVVSNACNGKRKLQKLQLTY